MEKIPVGIESYKILCSTDDSPKNGIGDGCFQTVTYYWGLCLPKPTLLATSKALDYVLTPLSILRV